MNIYVGNLAYEVTEDYLQTVFGEYGEISSCKVIMDQYSGRSKGFGFVEMPDKEAAEKAIQELNGKEIKGRALKVNEAKPPSNRRGGRGGGGNRGGFGNRGGGNREGGGNRGGRRY